MRELCRYQYFKVGEKLKYKNMVLECVKSGIESKTSSELCKGCIFKRNTTENCGICFVVDCDKDSRKDNTDVYFKRVK